MYVLVVTQDKNQYQMTFPPGEITGDGKGSFATAGHKIRYINPGDKLCGTKFQGRRPDLIIIDHRLNMAEPAVEQWYNKVLAPALSVNGLIVHKVK